MVECNLRNALRSDRIRKIKRHTYRLDATKNILETIATHRRVKTWKETSLEWLQYFGYGALGLITLFTLYKLGLLDVIRTYIPKKLCLFCVITNVETPTHVVIYNTGVQPLLQQERIKTRRIKIWGQILSKKGSVMSNAYTWLIE